MSLATRMGTETVPVESLAFDIDGVIADTMELFIGIVRRYHGISHIRKEDIVAYQLERCLDMDEEVVNDAIGRILGGNYDLPLRPISGARRVLRRISQHHNLLMVTARPYPGPMEKWLAQLLDGCPCRCRIVSVGSHEAKAAVLKEAGITHFVEDRLDTCFILDKEGIVPILFRQPWNRQVHPFLEVAGWDQLEALLSWP